MVSKILPKLQYWRNAMAFTCARIALEKSAVATPPLKSPPQLLREVVLLQLVPTTNIKANFKKPVIVLETFGEMRIKNNNCQTVATSGRIATDKIYNQIEHLEEFLFGSMVNHTTE